MNAAQMSRVLILGVFGFPCYYLAGVFMWCQRR